MKLREALEALARNRVDFVIVGGVAASIHGSTYTTLDLDLCYSRDTSNFQKLVDSLAPARPRLRGAPAGLPFGWDLTTLKNGFNFTLTTDFGDIALLAEITGVGDYEQVKAAALPVSLFGLQFLVISLDGLITAKRAAGRPKDLLTLPEIEALQEAAEGTE
jgi:hypothetical protein